MEKYILKSDTRPGLWFSKGLSHCFSCCFSFSLRRMLCSSRAVASFLAQTLDPSMDRNRGPTLTSLGIPSQEPCFKREVCPLETSRKLSIAYVAALPHFCPSDCHAPSLQDLGWILSPNLMLNTNDVSAGTIEGSSGLQEQAEENCPALARSITARVSIPPHGPDTVHRTPACV